jgi:hypothetical protein
MKFGDLDFGVFFTSKRLNKGIYIKTGPVWAIALGTTNAMRLNYGDEVEVKQVEFRVVESKPLFDNCFNFQT